ncbi:MAG TPA: proteasome accessory factor PafA2 family protein [Candidatus Saccharimonadales bacterium]|nr:proteasome accessory factor PafA2 family protein [Candidatus Saccharimonadales bacterium]
MIENRVFGSELEWGIRTSTTYPPVPKPEGWQPRFVTPSQRDVREFVLYERPTTLGGLDTDLDPSLSYAGTALSNGAVFYEDMDHPEYSTPEVIDPLELAACEIAGERILEHFIRKAVADDKFYQVILRKEVTDIKGNSWGYHENYQTLRERLSPKLAKTKHAAQYRILAAHLMSRCIYTGPGGRAPLPLDPYEQSPASAFVLAPKLTLLTEDMHESTIRQFKPLINLRDEPLMDTEKYTRQHIVSGSPNTNPWGTRMTFGTTSLVLAALEYNLRTKKDLRVYGPMRAAARKIASDTTGQAVVLLADGTTISSIDMQYEELEMARHVGERRQLMPWENWTLTEWEYVLGGLQRDPMSVADRVEWAYKMKLGITEGPRLAGWTALTGKGMGINKIRRERWAEWMPPERLIQERMVHAPPNTRAALREQFIRKFGSGAQRDYTASAKWNHFFFTEGDYDDPDFKRASVNINDPRAIQSDALDTLIKKYAA